MVQATSGQALPDITGAGPIVLAGAGKMGAALLEGWLAGRVPPQAIIVQDPQPSAHVAALATQHGFRLVSEGGAEVAGPPSVMVMAVKPQMMDDVFVPMAAKAGPETVVLSIAAGRTLESFARHLVHPAVVRAMPNTPASIGRGITGVVASASVSQAQKQVCTQLLSAVGDVVWVDDEALIDAITAVSGSGPAYVFYLVEAMTNAGIKAGLDATTAGRLARATVTGAGALLDSARDLSAAELRTNVTSPGGTTAAALEVLMRQPNGLEALMTDAVQAAKKRARELGS